MISPTITQRPKAALKEYISLLSSLGLVSDVDKLGRIAAETITHLRGTSIERAKSAPNQALQTRWYNALAKDEFSPDFKVYSDESYLSELWACWIVYSRGSLKECAKPNSLSEARSIFSDMGNIKSILDLGCGIGYTTAALKDYFPNADVVGSNLDTEQQLVVARTIGHARGIRIVTDISVAKVEGPTLVFASEYFEHFQKPLDHLSEIVETIHPTAFLIANAFGAKAIGHFDRYWIDGKPVSGSEASRLFNKKLRSFQYELVKTRLWNNRPSYWRLATNNTKKKENAE